MLIRNIMQPPARPPRLPYSVGKRSLYQSLSTVMLTPDQRRTVVSTLEPGGAVDALLPSFVVAKCAFVYIANHRVPLDGFVDIAGRVDGIIALRGLARIVGVYSIARRGVEKVSLATLVRVRLLQTQSPYPSAIGRNRFELTQKHYDLCFTHDRVRRTIEVRWSRAGKLEQLFIVYFNRLRTGRLCCLSEIITCVVRTLRYAAALVSLYI